MPNPCQTETSNARARRLAGDRNVIDFAGFSMRAHGGAHGDLIEPTASHPNAVGKPFHHGKFCRGVNAVLTLILRSSSS